MAAKFSRTPVRTFFTACLTLSLCISLVVAYESPVLVVAAPSPAPVTVPAPAPAPKVLTLHEKVVNALRAAGHYGAISGLLDSLSDDIIKPGITLFAPEDAAFNGMPMNSSSLLTTTLNYHIASKVYTYQELQNLTLNTTIPTAAPGVNIVVTSVVKGGFKLDNAGIANPDLYSDGQVAVQGINAVFDTAKYNKGVVAPEAAPAPVSAVSPPAPAVGTPEAAATTSSPTKNDATHIAAASTITAVLIVSTASLVMAIL